MWHFARLAIGNVKCALALILAMTGIVMAPAPAEAQFWQEFFRSTRERQARTLAPPRTRMYRPAPRSSGAAVTRRPYVATPATTGSTSPIDRREAAQSTTATKSQIDGGEAPILAIVSIADQRISLYGPDGLIESSKISSGTASNPTPTGIFGVTQKNRWHESNLYSGAEMPYMQRLTWGGIALHEGRLPGYPASHGCIRLPRQFAQRLFGMTKPGFRVVIAPDDVAPVPVTHRMLPRARYWPSTVAAATRPIRTASIGEGELAGLEQDQTTATMLNPIAYAAMERAHSQSELKAAEKAENAASTALQAAAKREKTAATALKAAEKQLAEATKALDRSGSGGPISDERRPLSPDAATREHREHAETLENMNAARIDEASARAEAENARSSHAAAEARVDWLKKRISTMSRRLQTASILISRKHSRLYVRQGLRAVFDIPISIREPEAELGNHVFVAAAPSRGETELRWLAVSMPFEDRPVRSGRPVPAGQRAVARAIRAETAAGALDRIEITGEDLDRISELVWAGSSLIVTDNGPGHDGIPGHDFAVETKH